MAGDGNLLKNLLVSVTVGAVSAAAPPALHHCTWHTALGWVTGGWALPRGGTDLAGLTNVPALQGLAGFNHE